MMASKNCETSTKKMDEQRGASNSRVYPPVGIFWDIENCQVPTGKSAVALVQKIRAKFIKGSREGEFMCVCDINRENKSVILELNQAQVTVVHIDATSKNAADEKLRQSMRRFADTHPVPATIILISSDVNFAGDLSDFRYRRGFNIILIHCNHVPQSLVLCSHQDHKFSDFSDDLPARLPAKVIDFQKLKLLVTNLPLNKEPKLIQNKLTKLSENCGGKVKVLTATMAVVSFSNHDTASRAQKRMDGQNVFGKKISVNFPTQNKDSKSPIKSMVSTQQPSFTQKNNDEQAEEVNKENVRLVSHNPLPSSPSSSSQDKIHKFYRGPPPDLIRQDNRNTKADVNVRASTELDGDMYRKNNALPTMEDPVKLNNYADYIAYYNYDDKELTGNYGHNLQTNYVYKPISDAAHVGHCYRSTDPLCGQGEFLMHNEQLDDADPSIKHLPQDNSFHHVCQQQVPLTLSHRVAESISGDLRLRHFNSSPHKFYPTSYSNEMHSNSKYELSIPSGTQSGYSSYKRYLTNDKDNMKDQVNFKPESNEAVSENSEQNVELRITNLDQSIDVRQLKKLLFSVFNEHVMVLHVSVSILLDGNYVAHVKVSSIHDAQFAISQLHRKKIGFKRILISMDGDQHNVPVRVLRSEVVVLMLDIPGNKLPLFKFRELFEKRYQRSISISDLCRIKDTLIIDEDGRGRMVSLNPEYRSALSPACSSSSTADDLDMVPGTYFCEIHYKPENSMNIGWAEKDSNINLPDVSISLKNLSTRIHTLLHSHDGCIPLSTIEWCYRSEFGPLECPNSEDSTAETYKYVPLEHLISCIPGIEILQMASGFKKINWAENKSIEDRQTASVSPTSALATQLVLFGREIVDLLKNSSRCQMQFNKFIPAYHHHFGRQCRVADYGYTKLADLMSAISHIVHVIGEGNKRLLTLTHRSQVKRFTADLLRVLKAQPNKLMLLADLPSAHLKCIGRNFNIVDYGVCSVLDMLCELPEGIINVSDEEQGTMISIPRRDQTPEEIDRTKQFAAEVVELVRHAPQCCMDFNKFIPAYHHHFGKQCRVADYGFTKLIELFEAIPDIVLIDGEGDDKLLHLTESEVLKVLAEQIVSLVKMYHKQHLRLRLSELPVAFLNLYGYNLRPEDYEVTNLEQLLDKIRHVIKVTESNDGPIVSIVDKGFVRELSLRVRRLLMNQLEAKMDIPLFVSQYKQLYGEQVNLKIIGNDLTDICIIEDDTIRLTMLQKFARDVQILLHENECRILLTRFDKLYSDRFGVPCRPAQYSEANVIALLQSVPDVAFLRGKGPKKMLMLNRETAGSPVKFYTPEKVKSKPKANDLIEVKSGSPVDLLAQPVPSCVPSPELRPNLNTMEPLDLIKFESPVNQNESLIEEEGTERSFLKTPPLVPNYDDLQDHLLNLSIRSPVEPKDDVMKALLNGTLPHLSISPVDHGEKYSIRTSHSFTPPPSMLPHPTYLLSAPDSENAPRSVHHSFEACTSFESSCENLTKHLQPSSHSTPTRRSKQTRSRIAAQFSVPLH